MRPQSLKVSYINVNQTPTTDIEIRADSIRKTKAFCNSEVCLIETIKTTISIGDMTATMKATSSDRIASADKSGIRPIPNSGLALGAGKRKTTAITAACSNKSLRWRSHSIMSSEPRVFECSV